MIPTKFFNVFALFCISIFVFSSCKDENGNPTIEKPVLAATPTVSNVGAGDNFPFSIDASGLNKLTKLTVEETYNGKKRMVLDSTFSPAKTGVTFAYNYHVPDSAAKGETITLVFAITDEKGNVTTDTETFTISYSKPNITLEADKTEGMPGDTVHFTAVITSAVPNLKELSITESRNGKLPTVLDTIPYPANTSSSTYKYSYEIPRDMIAGQSVVVLFKATNDEGTSASATKKITIK
ncbi:MAG: hypothetical protein EOP53_06145 [Sphingobacteriales bacterium]|nr:MAG: hypothetical protein EOP53_06145 [Sphingobacteriales bacterium]